MRSNSNVDKQAVHITQEDREDLPALLSLQVEQVFICFGFITGHFWYPPVQCTLLLISYNVSFTDILSYIRTFSVNSSPPLHTISLQCSKERNNVDISRLLVFLSRLTTCPPMVYALKLLYENSYLKLPCWVSICISLCAAFLYAACDMLKLV